MARLSAHPPGYWAGRLKCREPERASRMQRGMLAPRPDSGYRERWKSGIMPPLLSAIDESPRRKRIDVFAYRE
jgi:hypothetical protein